MFQKEMCTSASHINLLQEHERKIKLKSSGLNLHRTKANIRITFKIKVSQTLYTHRVSMGW